MATRCRIPVDKALRIAGWCFAAMLALGGAAAWAGDAAPLGLREAIDRALAHDPQLRGARALAEAVDAQGRQARSRLWPSAGLSANFGRSTDLDPPTVVERSTRRSEAFLRWNLFNGLADRTQIDALAAEAAAAGADWQRALDEACERVGQAYLELLRQQRLAGHARQRLAEIEDLARRVGRQAALGKGSDADAQLAEASLIDARVASEAVAADEAAARTQLRVLMGEGPADPADALVVMDPKPALGPEGTLVSWGQRAQARNAQWRAAEARAAAARARVAAVAPEYLPRVDLELRKSLSDRTTPAPSSTQQRGWAVSITYEVPLGGGAGARRDEARHRADVAEAELRRIGDTVQAEVAALWQRARQAADAAPQLARQREHLDAVVRAGELQYDAGRRSLMQLIEQRDRRYGVQQREVDNAWRLAAAHWRLQVLGGGLAEVLGIAAVP
ncbi:TolC family protein [Aquincola sp. MAHUQ-54]|uniref:TolC family protein n=1 Tax=Aquincola agrisoli TaxID=3119538 RepID=A0AAW9QHN4_9BURK